MKILDFIKVKLATYILQPLLNNPRRPVFFKGLKTFKHSRLIDNRFLAFFKNGYLDLQVLEGGFFRLITGFTPTQVTPYYDGQYFSYAVLPKEKLPLHVFETAEIIEIRPRNSVSNLLVRIDKQKGCLQVINNGRLIYKQKKPTAHKKAWVREEICCTNPIYFLGFGQKTGGLCKNGKTYRMWNTDNSDINRKSDPLYQSCPLAIFQQTSGQAFGLFFDNPHYSVFKLSKLDQPGRLLYFARRGPLVIYILPGPSLKDVVQQFSSLTGHYSLPPLWVLGHHHSRWEPAENAERLLKIASEFRRREIPCDALHLDIGHLDGFRCFTWNKKSFPQPKDFIEKIKALDFQPVVISDPGLKKDPSWLVYEEAQKNDCFLKDPEGNICFEPVWPGEVAFPDFANPQACLFWGKLYKHYTDDNIHGFWIDMNEPSTFTARRTLAHNIIHRADCCGTPRDHASLHNYYSFLMAKATAEGLKKLLPKERFFLFTRSAYAGIQRYAASWTGDNRSNWEHLKMSIPMLLNIGLSGQVMCGPDIGGFWGSPSAELLIRFFQCATFFPFHRNHTASETPPQEIWAFDEKTEKICKQALALRYAFLPYLYTQLRECCNTGLPLIRPIFFEYPAEKNCYLPNFAETQYFCGPSILVCPILTPKTISRKIYFPGVSEKERDELWICYWTHKRYKAGEIETVSSYLDRLAFFVRAGSVVPATVSIQNTQEFWQKPIILLVYGRKKFSGQLYLDDGQSLAYEKGLFSLLEIKGEFLKQKIVIEISRRAGKLKPIFAQFKEILLKIARCPGDHIPLGVEVNQLKFKQEQLELTYRWISIKIQLKDLNLADK